MSQTLSTAAERTPPIAHAGTRQALGRISSFSWLAISTTLATYALIIIGGVVRSTGSGDACPDWPRCHGQLLPPLESDVLIEFSHRLTASVVGLLVLATAMAAWRSRRRVAAIVWGSTAAVLLVIAQIILGGATVLSELSADLVMAHMALATALLLTLLFVTIESLRPHYDGASVSGAEALGRLAAVIALATFGLMLTGAYVSGSNAGLAVTDWPLFNGRLVPDGGRLVMIHATHRLAVVLVGLLVAYLAARAWTQHRGNRVAVAGASLAAGLYLAQVLVGAANVWSKLAPAANAAHLALAEGILVTLAATALLALRARAPAREAPVVEAEPGRAGRTTETLAMGRPG